MTDESVVERIKKLVALALNNPNEAEAAVAMTKARELMLKHAVDEAKLRGKNAPQEVDVYTVNLGRAFESWMKLTQLAVSRLYDAMLYISKKNGIDTATFICAKEDYELLRESYALAVAVILRESARALAGNNGGRAYATSFRAGAAQGLLDAVMAAKEAPMSKASTAIVLVRNEAIKAKALDMFPLSRNKTLRYNASNSNGFEDGYAFGRAMDAGRVSKKIEG